MVNVSEIKEREPLCHTKRHVVMTAKEDRREEGEEGSNGMFSSPRVLISLSIGLITYSM